MPSIFSKILSLPPGGLGRVVVGSKPINNSTGITVTAAIFFDGTGNNRNNTAQRRMAEHNAAHPDAPRHEEKALRLTRRVRAVRQKQKRQAHRQLRGRLL
jgi:hypothetical protein